MGELKPPPASACRCGCFPLCWCCCRVFFGGLRHGVCGADFLSHQYVPPKQTGVGSAKTPHMSQPVCAGGLVFCLVVRDLIARSLAFSPTELFISSTTPFGGVRCADADPLLEKLPIAEDRHELLVRPTTSPSGTACTAAVAGNTQAASSARRIWRSRLPNGAGNLYLY